MSPSAAALKIIREMGYDWPKVSGMDYWQYDGTRLSNLGADSERDPDDAIAD